GSDVSDNGGVLGNGGVVGCLEGFFPFSHDLIELLDEIGPLLGSEVVEGLVVVAAELAGLFTFKPHERPLVPEDEVVGELAYGVIPFAVGPLRLIGGEAGDGSVAGGEPVLGVMGGAELFEKDAFERGGRRFGWRVLGVGGGNGEGQGD